LKVILLFRVDNSIRVEFGGSARRCSFPFADITNPANLMSPIKLSEIGIRKAISFA